MTTDRISVAAPPAGADMVRTTSTTPPTVLRVYPALASPTFMLLWLGMMPATLAVMINWKFHQVPISLAHVDGLEEWLPRQVVVDQS